MIGWRWKVATNLENNVVPVELATNLDILGHGLVTPNKMLKVGYKLKGAKDWRRIEHVRPEDRFWSQLYAFRQLSGFSGFPTSPETVKKSEQVLCEFFKIKLSLLIHQYDVVWTSRCSPAWEASIPVVLGNKHPTRSKVLC